MVAMEALVFVEKNIYPMVVQMEVTAAKAVI
jgi:hypothetical protein